MIPRCSKYAVVGDKGEILLGRGVVADAFAKRLLRVVTHAHKDHTRGLRSSIRWSLYVLATPVTFRFLEVLGETIPREKRLELSYNKRINVDGESIEFRRARHIAGSAQVIVESSGCRVGYTGDFKLPGTDVLEDLDVLVVDATYGSPRYQRRWSDWEALQALIELIEDRIKYGPVWIYGFHGKLQEVMIELRKRGVDYPYLAEPVTIKLARITAEEYGVDLGDTRSYLGGPVDESAIVFIHASKRRSKTRLPGTHVRLTGWEVRSMVRMTGPDTFNVSFSDHATFREIIEYVRDASPKMVVVDAYRGKDAWYTAKYIERLLGIPATYMPRVKNIGKL